MVDKEAVRKQLEKAIQSTLAQAAVLAQDTINAYLLDLEQHIGKIPGTNTSDLGWQPLDQHEDPGHTFWYKTGNVASHIISTITIDKNRIHVVAGLPSGAPGYQEALWNEFGWTPHGTHRVVRRALFVPLAEHHLLELNAKLHEQFSKMKLKIRVNI